MSEDLQKQLQKFHEKTNKLFGSLPMSYQLSKGIFEIYNLGTKPEWEAWLKDFQESRTILRELEEKCVAFKHANAIIPRAVYDNKEVVETLKDLFKCLLGEEVVVVPKQKLKELSDRYHCGTSKERFYVICGFLKELFKET